MNLEGETKTQVTPRAHVPEHVHKHISTKDKPWKRSIRDGAIHGSLTDVHVHVLVHLKCIMGI
jgi:hypothetical protein